MNSNQVNMWLSMNADKFNQQDLGPIRRTLEAIPDDQMMLVQNIEFRKPSTIFLIAFLLGWERFLLDNILLGILKVLTCYGCGIWWLVDVISAKNRARIYNYQQFQKATGALGFGNNNGFVSTPIVPDISANIDTNQPISYQSPNNTSAHVPDSDFQRWQHAIQGIASKQSELLPNELSAFQELVTLINSDNFESGKSSANIQIIKNALNQHSNNRVLSAYLTNFVTLCDKYFKIQTAAVAQPASVVSSQQITPPAFEPPQSQSPVATTMPPEPQIDPSVRIDGMQSDKPQVQQPYKLTDNSTPKSRMGNSPVLIILCLVIMLLVGYIAFKDNVWFNKIFRKDFVVSVAGVSLSTTTLTLNIGDSYQIIPFIQPSNATNRRVLWRSDNSDVAIVYGEDGIVIARGAGVATITATTQDGRRTAICNVSVITSPTSSVRARNYYFGEYTGDLKNGIPEGDGKIIYNRRMQIAKHDTNNPPHYAEQGDYFIGSWGNGDIVSGYLYRRDGNIKERIIAPKRFNPYDINND